MKIQPLWLDGPLEGSDREIEYPLLSRCYVVAEDIEYTVGNLTSEFGPDKPLHYYYFHKFAFLEHIFIVASRHSDLTDVEYISMHHDTLFNLFVSDRAKKAERYDERRTYSRPHP
jgi:hypothetical protein